MVDYFRSSDSGMRITIEPDRPEEFVAGIKKRVYNNTFQFVLVGVTMEKDSGGSETIQKVISHPWAVDYPRIIGICEELKERCRRDFATKK